MSCTQSMRDRNHPRHPIIKYDYEKRTSENDTELLKINVDMVERIHRWVFDRGGGMTTPFGSCVGLNIPESGDEVDDIKDYRVWNDYIGSKITYLFLTKILGFGFDKRTVLFLERFIKFCNDHRQGYGDSLYLKGGYVISTIINKHFKGDLPISDFDFGVLHNKKLNPMDVHKLSRSYRNILMLFRESLMQDSMEEDNDTFLKYDKDDLSGSLEALQKEINDDGDRPTQIPELVSLRCVDVSTDGKTFPQLCTRADLSISPLQEENKQRGSRLCLGRANNVMYVSENHFLGFNKGLSGWAHFDLVRLKCAFIATLGGVAPPGHYLTHQTNQHQFEKKMGAELIDISVPHKDSHSIQMKPLDYLHGPAREYEELTCIISATQKVKIKIQPISDLTQDLCRILFYETAEQGELKLLKKIKRFPFLVAILAAYEKKHNVPESDIMYHVEQIKDSVRMWSTPKESKISEEGFKNQTIWAFIIRASKNLSDKPIPLVNDVINQITQYVENVIKTNVDPLLCRYN